MAAITVAHLSGAGFNLIAGIQVVHVGFKGRPDATVRHVLNQISKEIAASSISLT